MIESNKSDINVDELMQRIRDEVAYHERINRLQYLDTFEGKNSKRVNGMPNTHVIEKLIDNVGIYAKPLVKWPDKLNRFPFNRSHKLREFFIRLYNFSTKKQRTANSNIVAVQREFLSLFRQQSEKLIALKKQLQDLEEQLETTQEELETTQAQLETTQAQLETTQVETTQVATTQAQLNHNSQRLEATQVQLEKTRVQLQASNERFTRHNSYLRSDLAQQKRLITLFLEEAYKRLPEPFEQEESQTFLRENQHSLDTLYVAFEDQFRGSRELISDRLKVYLPFVRELDSETLALPIIDIGCGRGEWLELLKMAGYAAKGIDLNRPFLEQCKTRELEVIESDGITYLEALPDQSVSVITGFHIIEHLPFKKLVRLFEEASRVLKSGGLLIFETPDPENVLVGSCRFYFDPTHRNPLPSPVVQFLTEFFGFQRVNILKLNPLETTHISEDTELGKLLNQYFFGPMDYAVIGFKP